MAKNAVSHKPGDIVKLGGIDFVVLDNNMAGSSAEPETLFILAVNSQGESRFGDSNNYAVSDLREAVMDWLTMMVDDKGVDLNAIIPRTIDLLTLDGFKGYGTLEVKAAPLTLDEARKYADLIPECDAWTWLATGWGRPGNVGSGYAWNVSSNGGWNSNHCTYSYGIRPALILSSTLLVSDDGSVNTNTAPTTPGSITVPSSIMGGTTITVSWAKSTDTENNLAGYKVERSTNGGSAWSQIYQGTALSTTNAVAFGTSSVMYRVKAYDDEGLESGWKTSSQITVVNNNAPGTPSSISVPNTVKGGQSLVVSWGSASDTDGNLSGYILERAIDGTTTWTQVYKGNALTYTDTITKGWTKVQYRVKAYDSYNAESGYQTSTVRTVDNNTAPTITCSNASGSNLGTKTSGFTISYSVDDVDAGDTLTVTEQLDGVTKRTFSATRKQSNSFAVTGDYFQKILNGSHTLKISVSDGKETANHTLTFTKNVTSASITLSAPMEADDKITVCAITVTGSIPADAEYKVEVTNNGKDTAPVWEDATADAKNGRNHLFTNDTQTNGWAFNFRVTATRGSSNAAGYITSIQGGFQ